jgi:hypothetical protein
MKIRTTPSKHLPLVRLEEAIRRGVNEMYESVDSVGTYVVTCTTQSIRSTACRLAVVYSKLSNVKQESNVEGLESVQSLQCNAQRSLDAARSSESASLFVLPEVGGHPQEGGRSLIYDPPRTNA